MANDKLLVTGASGKLGQRVLELLLSADAGPIVATTRKPETLAAWAARGVEVRRADYDAPETLATALAGVERALLISTDSIERPGQRLEQQRRAVRALEAAGVRHVVYTSMPRPEGSPVIIAPDHFATEQALTASRLDFTILRNNIYADMLLLSLPGAIASGQLIDARGKGAIAYVWRDDCARAAAAALADRSRGARTIVDITGPEAVTSAQLAAWVSDLFGRPVAHVDVPPAALVEGLQQHGLPPPVAQILASFDVAISRGELADVSDGVRQLTGRAPQSLRAFLQAHRDALQPR
jgi:NAD(P)H dehydrogenase (quinone)